jgi:hypothetical protein
MKIHLTEYDLKTLDKDENGYKYAIHTKKGVVRVEGIDTKENALKHAENTLKTLMRSILKKH